MAEGGFLKKSLKWAFRIAVWGIGFGIGSELITEFLTYGVMHGGTELSGALAHMSKEFTEPIMHSINNAIGGADGLNWLEGILKGIHEFFGIEGTFLPPAVTDVATAAASKVGVGTLAESFVPGM